MQEGSNPKIIEELKAAGEELKKVQMPKFARTEEKPRPVEKAEGMPSFAKVSEDKERFGLFKKIGEYRKETTQELSVLEKTYQEIKGLEKKLEQRIELLKRLRDKSIQIDKELKQFQEELILAKKENKSLLEMVNQLIKKDE